MVESGLVAEPDPSAEPVLDFQLLAPASLLQLYGCGSPERVRSSRHVGYGDGCVNG